MATPAFRALRRKCPEATIDIAVQPLLRDSRLLDNYTYFNSIYSVHNPWHSKDYETGMDIVRKQIANIQELKEFQEIKWVMHKQDAQHKLHKVFLTAKELGVELDGDTVHEAYVTDEEENEALAWLKQNNYSIGDYAFIHANSSDIKKNISAKTFKEMMPERYHNKTLTIGESFDITRYPIGFSIALLKYSGFTALVDSVFVHCADAFHKDIDIYLTTLENHEVCHPLHIRTHKILQKEITKTSRAKYKINRLYYRLQPELKRRSRNWLYLITFGNPANKKNIREWFIGYAHVNNKPSKDSILIIGLAVKLYNAHFIITRPYLCYLKKTANGFKFLEFESADPMPSKGLELLRAGSSGPDFQIKKTMHDIQEFVNKAVCQKTNRRHVWAGQYDIEKQQLIEPSIIDKDPFHPLAGRFEPFVSDEDVKNFFQRLFAVCN